MVSKERTDEGYKPLTHHRDEERYFFERDRELVAELRKKADALRMERERAQAREQHWMRCPKCGGVMEELRYEVLVLDRCADCRGVYFDDGELEILRKLQLQSEDGPIEFLSRLVARLSA